MNTYYIEYYTLSDGRSHVTVQAETPEAALELAAKNNDFDTIITFYRVPEPKPTVPVVPAASIKPPAKPTQSAPAVPSAPAAPITQVSFVENKDIFGDAYDKRWKALIVRANGCTETTYRDSIPGETDQRMSAAGLVYTGRKYTKDGATYIWVRRHSNYRQ